MAVTHYYGSVVQADHLSRLLLLLLLLVDRQLHKTAESEENVILVTELVCREGALK